MSSSAKPAETVCAWPIVTAQVLAVPVHAPVQPLKVDNTGDTIIENAGNGNDTVFSSQNYTLPGNVENLTLTGELYVNAFGNNLDNTLRGNSSGNILVGYDGADIGYGGQGDDWYIGIEQVVENAGEGIDTIVSDGGVLPDNVENLYMGFPSSSWIPPGYVGPGFFTPLTWSRSAAIGNSLDNMLVSPGDGSYNIHLDGKEGADTMVVNGSDKVTVYIDNPNDKVIGTPERIYSSIDYALPQASSNNGITKNLTLFGNTPITGVGNQADNLLSNEGNSTVTLIGSLGNDTYNIGLNDHVVELAGGGNDTVNIYAGNPFPQEFFLSNFAFDNVEQIKIINGFNVPLTIHGDAQDNDFTIQSQQGYLYGDAGNDRLTGWNYNDVLDGGSGNDTMVGGNGNDTYVIDCDLDVITEGINQGYDTVQSSLNYTLANNLEVLTLLGTSAIDGSGNTDHNIITGNAAANTLQGLGGNDQLFGGKTAQAF